MDSNAESDRFAALKEVPTVAIFSQNPLGHTFPAFLVRKGGRGSLKSPETPTFSNISINM
jgi:hypothetical protein